MVLLSMLMRNDKIRITRYYLNNILKDYGIDQLKIAIQAVDLHFRYYSKLDSGNLRGSGKLVEEFKNQIADEN
jgi:hypothetical protein